MSCLTKLFLNNVRTREKVFWVNLVDTQNYFHSINIINYQASTIDEYVFGKKSPTIISLPVHQPKVEFVYKFRNYNESNTSKHNYHNRRSSRSNKLFHTNYNLNTEYLTIFITQSYILPYKRWMNEKDFIIFVPYFKTETAVKNSIFQTVKYGVILQTQLYKLHNIHKNMYNSKLQLIEKGNFELVQTIDDRAVRFCILPDIEFSRYYNEKTVVFTIWT